MKTSSLPLRIPNASGLPLRVARLLGDGRFTVLDGIDTALYSEAMNKIPGRSGSDRKEAPKTGGSASMFAFLGVAEQLYVRIAEALASVGLSYAKYELLRNLHDAAQPVTLGVLAEGQGCARSNITQLMDRLEADGLVRRVDDPADRRSVRAELTSLGAAKAEEGAGQIDSVRAEFAASFTADERRQLGRLLDKLR